MQPLKVNFKLYQGSTFKEVLRWESSTKTYKPISAITKSAPCTISCTGHGLTNGWRFKVTNAKGMKEINSSEYYTATISSPDEIVINSLNTLDFTDYTTGGVVEYNTPVSLAGTTARMQLREKLDSATTITELTTENGGIVIDDVAKTIIINISATATSLFNFQTAVYSLELINGSEVTPFITGNISLVKEVTR